VGANLQTEIAPVQRQALSELVAQRLLGLIQSGNLRPGQQLPPERELAETLNVSRPSLREALRALSLLGVLRIRQGGGVFVSALDPEALLGPLHFFISLDEGNIENLFEARIVVESAITGLAAVNIKKADLDRLRDCVASGSRHAKDIEKFVESDVEFHRIVFQSSGNSFLQRIATSLHLLGRASREITGQIPGVVNRSLQDHRKILAALEAHDAEAAERAMRSHLENVWSAYRRNSRAS
jgi:GntR family transcriptional regulator, transcriptional repressor for pyruvate dehydrogenase complex